MKNNAILPIEKEKTVTVEIIFSFPNEMEHEEVEGIVKEGVKTISMNTDFFKNFKEYHINYDYMLPDFDGCVSFEDNYFED
jgi:hypothetical protein